MRLILLLLIPALPAFQSISPAEVPPLQGDEILQLKNSREGEPVFLVGKVLKIKEKTIVFEDHNRGILQIPIDSVEPYSLYRAKKSRIDDSSASDRYQLGEWCLSQELYTTAVREFNEAKQLDRSLRRTCDRKIKTCREEDARTKFEEAKRLILQQHYDSAAKRLHYILKRYSDTPYGEKAREESDKMAALIRAGNREKEEMLKAKKEADEKAQKDAGKFEKMKAFDEVKAALDTARNSFTDALLWEGKDNLTRCRRLWQSSASKLVTSRTQLKTLLESEDTNVVKEAIGLDAVVVEWLVRIYWRLGRNYAEHLSYSEALKYLNGALALPHDSDMDRLINELTLTITRLRMRMRASGRGY